jgi:hypothetical protein
LSVLSLHLFRAKTLTPPLSLLDELGIQWRPEFVEAGRVITGDGDPVHFGLSLSDAETTSFATSQLDLESDFLEQGPPTVLRHMQWWSAWKPCTQQEDWSSGSSI